MRNPSSSGSSSVCATRSRPIARLFPASTGQARTDELAIARAPGSARPPPGSGCAPVPGDRRAAEAPADARLGGDGRPALRDRPRRRRDRRHGARLAEARLAQGGSGGSERADRRERSGPRAMRGRDRGLRAEPRRNGSPDRSGRSTAKLRRKGGRRMNRETPSALLLFELLARHWSVPAPAVGLVFNRSESRLAAPLADGSLALVDFADPEPPESRIATDDAGRRTIAPRRSEPRPATIVAACGTGPAEAV